MENLKYRNLLILTVTSILLILVFTQPAWSAQIKLAWDANTASDLNGYKVYYGTVSKSYTGTVDIGDITTYTLTGLSAGQTYFIVVTAYDTSYNESVYSIEVSGVAIEVVTPGPTVPPTITPPPTPTHHPSPPPSHSPTPPPPSNTTCKMYLAVSQTNTSGPPIGNIKSYEVSTANASNTSNTSTSNIHISNSTNISAANTTNVSTGVQVLDSTKTPALDSNNLIKDSSKSSWSSETDGKQVDKGGVGEVLLKRDKARNIFTNFGDSNLMSESNEFATSNEKITPELLGFAQGDTVQRDKLIQFIQGYDAYSKVKGKSASEKRKWILGAIVNSRPLVIHYGDSRSVIFAGANDGIFHAFDNATGEELWGFIPDELLNRLKNLTSGNKLEYFVDGSPKGYITESQKIIIFGLRRGGSYYSALDVTDPDNPRFLWEIGPETTGFSEMGQTWSTPQIGKIKHGSGEKVVCFIGGGYDENQDKKTPATEDKKGRAVYVVDLFTGQQVWRWDYARDPNMKYSIPSDISCVDTNGDGYIDRLYVGDTGGKLWRFDINGSDPTAWSGSTLFNSSAGLLGGSRKIFSRPDVTLEKGHEMLFFGTGDREHPDETKVMNQIYAIKDKGLNSTLSERDLENVTDGINNLKSIEDKEGWVISLENKGEKALAHPVVIFGVAYFTTFAPSSGSTEGIARIYALDYKNGGPIIDLNAENNTEGIKIDLSDRSRIIGTGIPSGVVFSAINGKPVGYAGFQGGVYNTPLKKNSTIIPIWWREVSKK
jgi:type IV pilus assembly protein PilY1